MRTVTEALNTHGLAKNHINGGGITTLQESGSIFQLFPRTTINLLIPLSKLASNLSCVTIQHSCIFSTALAGIVQDNHLGCKASCFHWWVTFGVTRHTATMDIFDRHVLDIEGHVVPRKSFTQRFMVHFNRVYFSRNTDWSKGDHHAVFENTSLHSAHMDSTYTNNFIDVLDGQTQGLVNCMSWWQDVIQSFK